MGAQPAMQTDRNQILETDALEPGPSTAEPSQPVVVVQYRNRGVPAWALVLLICMVPLTILVYHRLVVERYRSQTVANQLALESIIDEHQPAAPDPVVQEPRAPLALNSQPLPNGPQAPASVTPATSPQPLPASPNQKPETPAVAKSDTRPLAVKPGEKAAVSGVVAEPPGPTNNQSPSEKTADQKKGVRTILESPFLIDEPDAIASEATAVSNPKVPTGADRPAPTKAAADPKPKAPQPGNVAKAAVAGTAGSVGAVPRGSLTGPKNPADHAVELPPLPTKEEEERLNEEEAAEKRAELVHRVENRMSLARETRNEERRKFRDELRAVLRAGGEDVEAEIDKLAQRYGYEADRDRLAEAGNIWRFGRISQAAKVQKIRDLDLPETVVLNMLSDDLYLKLRTRNGPRNKSDVRIMAARQLLSYELPAVGAKGSTVGRSPAAGGRTTAQPPATKTNRAVIREP
jgi:hypothetical protein